DRLGGMTQSLLWVAIALHLASIVLRGLAVNRFPLGNLYEYMMMITFGALLAMMIAMQRKEWRTLWPWVLTPLLALMFYGSPSFMQSPHQWYRHCSLTGCQYTSPLFLSVVP